MRRRIKYPLLIVLPISLLLGGAWGLKIQRDRQAAAVGRGQIKAEIRVLAFKNLLTAELLNRFERETSIRARVIEVSSPEELWDQMAHAVSSTASADGAAFDVVSVYSYQLPLAMQMARLQPMTERLVPNIRNVAPDFRELPGDRAFLGFVPVLWGLTGIFYDEKKFASPPGSWADVLAKAKREKYKVLWPSSTVEMARVAKIPADVKELRRFVQPWLTNLVLAPDALSASSLLVDALQTKSPAPFAAVLVNHGETAFPPLTSLPQWHFTVPDDGATLWTLGFAISHDTKLSNEAHEFLNFVLERDPALELARAFRQASVNRVLEASDIDQRLKASYLRQVPLNKFTLIKDFSRAHELRELMPLRPPLEATKEDGD